MNTQNTLSSAHIIFDLFGVLFQKEYSSDGRSAYRPIPKGSDLLRECAEHHRCYLLSNASTQTIEILQTQYPEIFSLFDGIVTSEHAGYAKPDTRMFHYIIDTFNLYDKPCIFIDDTLTNITAAEHVGMIGVHWVDGDNVRATLKKLQVLD